MVACAPSSVGGVLVTVCLTTRGEPRLGRFDGAGALIPRLQELGPVHGVGAPAA